MYKLSVVAILTLFILSWKFPAAAQSISTDRHAIAVFAPLYLDSAFSGEGEYKYGKDFPKFINPGLEFYEGVQLAADSLNRSGAGIDIFVYDTRSITSSVKNFRDKPEFGKIELILGSVVYNDIKPLADAAREKNIPFINVNLPNDANVRNNPSYVLLNSTLRTHIDAMYKFLQKTHGTSNIIVFRKKGAQEDMLKGMLTEAETNTLGVSLKLKYINLNDNFTADQIKPYLDSNRSNVVVACSLDENFARALGKRLALMNGIYPLQLLGMPTWDGMKDFERKEYKGLEIIYSTPFYNPKSDKISITITNYFKTNFYSRPTDMVFRGYETLLRFGKLLMEKGPNLVSSIGEKKYRVFTDFDIQPVFSNKQSPTLDYFENKKLYFVRMTDGVIRGAY